ncbi:ATP-binding protein [Nostoc sp. 'Peltigera membranacea cyanobiont' 210A]|uniref:sensor histidine kinase n=1 Tax=Nostoc sp. 'Peltigera membranacea cyanobiont' 210A TaxID=2014529 RepID=UPI000B957CC4|nr:GAF domain-containing protein [Nostoc sp. 'Peltigera membranacea cyanobiont' 210A]OYD93743.1 ATP-binding protein [Nostoc sp. 'Peltigera membranacea cyanobiont' 210A]
MGQPQKPIAAEQQILSLGRVLQSLREEEDVDVLIETTISYLKEEFDYKLIWIALYDRLNHILFGKGGITPDRDMSFLRQRVVLSPGDLLEQVVIEQHPLGVADLQTEIRAAEWRKVAEKFHIQGTIILPIRYKDRCLGLVLLGSERWGYLLTGETKARLMMVLGELGAVLYQNEMHKQQKQTRRTDEPLLELLENLRTLSNLNQRLEAAVQATHKFVSPSRTNVYWFEREGRYFWCRMSNQLVKMDRNSSSQQAAGMTVQDLSDFYYALAVNQIVSIGDARSSLKSHFTAKLLQRLNVRSLLAAPIIWQKNLVGFLAVESNEPRIWTDTDKNFVQGVAGLISLVVPTESMESTIKQIQEDAQLTSQVAQGIYSEHDLQTTLHSCAKRVLARLGATRFLLLQYDPEQKNYQFTYQSQPQNRRPLTFTLQTLKELDGQLLQGSTQAVEIENLDEDLRFFNWRPLLLENNVRSLLVCKCTHEHIPAALLVITHDTHRSWTTLEKELLWAVSQQIGVIVRQWQLHNRTTQQQKTSQAFEQCLRILTQSQNSIEVEKKHLESTALEQIASILGCPLALMLSWAPGESRAEIIPGVIDNSQFGIFSDVSIYIQAEALIQWALVTENYLTLKVDNLPPETRKWLNVPDKSQILVMALRTTADYETTGVVLLVDYQERRWSEQNLSATATLISQLAWWRREKQITRLLESTTEELRQLNWYKHRRLEEIQRITAHSLKQIHDLGIPANELTQMRYQLLLRQLDHTATSMSGMLKLEHWQLHISWETMPIASLLKRSLERIDNLLKQQKLWIGVHGLGQPIDEQEAPKNSSLVRGVPPSSAQSAMAIAGDIVKIELVIHELLVTACNRSQTGSRIDIWCRRLDASKPSDIKYSSSTTGAAEHQTSLELSITYNGAIEPQLLTELHDNTPKDVLAPSKLDQPPALHLVICQNLMQELGGELNFYQLPDNRVVSRLLLPLAIHDS